MSESSARIVSVEIHGLRYPIRSSLDPAYVGHLAAYVDAKMQAAAEEAPSSESLKVAVVAALNIADEYFRQRETGGAAPDECPPSDRGARAPGRRGAGRSEGVKRGLLQPSALQSKISSGY